MSRILATLSILQSAAPLFAQGTAFTYQGRLNDGASPASGIFDFRFTVYDSSGGAGIIAGPLTNPATIVSNGLFTVTIDPDVGVFTGAARWMEIAVRTNGAGAFVALSPRQAITASPYAVFAGSADASGLAGTIPSSSLSGTYTEPLSFDNPANSYSGTFYGQFLGLSFIGGSFAGSFIGNGSGLANLNGTQILAGTIPSAALGNSWRTMGNAGTTPGTHFIGTTDNRPLEFRVNNQRVLQIGTNANASPNIVAGSPANSITGTNIEGATIAGGGIGLYPNTITASYATIGGGTFHTIGGAWSTIAGGRDNLIQADHSTIGGGHANHIKPLSSYASIAGGGFNVVNTNAYHSTVGGGYANGIGPDSFAATIAGGYANNVLTTSAYASVGGGAFNTVGGTNYYSAIGGGGGNSIADNSSYSVIAGGVNNQISPNSSYATIPGGSQNVATNHALAAGFRAKAVHTGTFVWSDSQFADFVSTTNNEVAFRCAGGVRFTGGGGGGLNTVSWLPGSGSWSFTSDRKTKENLKAVDTQRVLEKVAALPLHEWNYIGYAQRHVGPMAQDFHAAFPLNDNETVLNDTDLHGVTLAAIQGLNQKLETQQAENAELKQRLEKLEKLLQQRH